MTTLAEMQEQVHAWCERKGWRGDGAPFRTFGDDIALLHSEASEALEAYREWGTAEMIKMPDGVITPVDDLPEDFVNLHILKPEGVASELADILIRLLDTCATYDIDLEQQYHLKMEYNETRQHRHGGKRL